MKKRLYITSFALLIVLVAGLGVNYLVSLRKVTFDLENGTDTITIYSSNDEEIKQISSDGRILVQSGEYYLIPKGDTISSDKIEFSVENEDKTITVKPPHTKEFLESKLKEEIADIEAAVASRYPSLINGYTLSQGTLYGQGDWYGGLLKPKVSDIREQKDPYRIILHKKDGKWEVIRRPEYTLTSSRYKEVPIDILREVNQIVGEPGN